MMLWTYRLILLTLLAYGGWELSAAAGTHGKAWLGQQLLERSWQRLRAGDVVAAPWPGADIRPVARLSVPRLGVEQLVLAGLEGQALAWGPGMVTGPGGHRIIAAHRDTHFGFLRHLRHGDALSLTLPDGSRTDWIVADHEVIDARRTGLDLDTGFDLLTLVTCYPFDAVQPGGPLRLVISLLPAEQTARDTIPRLPIDKLRA